MTDFAEPTSLTLDTEPTSPASGGGQPPMEQVMEPVKEEPRKPESVRDSLEKAAKSVNEKEAAATKEEKVEQATKEDSEKPADEPKAEEAAEDKPKAADAQEGDKTEAKPSEGKARIEPPARLLPKHRELWKSVPHELRAELVRLSDEDASERTRLTEHTQRYAEVAEFDDLARQNGGSLRQSIERIHHLENLLQQNPVAALNQIVLQSGLRKNDGQPLSFIELAHAVTRMEQGQYAQMINQPQQQQRPQENPEVAQLKAQMADMQKQHIEATVIGPFKNDHPRYDELELHIATILNSGMIPQSLSPDQKLAHAYDMADRLYPAQQDDVKAPDTERGGTSTSKSIKSTPGSVSDRTETNDKGKSIKDLLEDELRKSRLRG